MLTMDYLKDSISNIKTIVEKNQLSDWVMAKNILTDLDTIQKRIISSTS